MHWAKRFGRSAPRMPEVISSMPAIAHKSNYCETCCRAHSAIAYRSLPACLQRYRGVKGKGRGKGGAAPTVVVGEEVGGIRGRPARHECAGAIGSQKTRSARVGRYDKEALRNSSLHGI